MARPSVRLAAAGGLVTAAVLATTASAGAGLPDTVTGAGQPLASGGVAPAPGVHGIIDSEEAMVDCDTAQLLGPAATSTAHVTGDDRVSLDMQVVIDTAEGVAAAGIADPEARAAAEQALFDEVADRLAVGMESYAPLDIDLTFAGFDLLDPTRETRTDNAQELIDLAKEQYGGERPAGADVVYVLTDLDIQLPGLGNAVAGLADCIGGVAHADRAFAVGETKPVEDEEIPIGPLTFYQDLTAKIMAHEIGHLMGGHHHYQECGTPVVVAVQRGETGPCSLMTNAVDFQTIPFSTLNGVVVRGHAETWATSNDEAPPTAPDGHAH